MWIEELAKGKYKYIERYKDPYTEELKKVSITLTSKSNVAKKQAQKELNEKIDRILTAEKNLITHCKSFWMNGGIFILKLYDQILFVIIQTL
ncbi:hypothetical protein [Enterococcus sp.]|uniref:hypothetical protein n=1 Tax=Enterococcus sp. TaxID=35783 RepID=UPI0039911A12